MLLMNNLLDNWNFNSRLKKKRREIKHLKNSKRCTLIISKEKLILRLESVIDLQHHMKMTIQLELQEEAQELA